MRKQLRQCLFGQVPRGNAGDQDGVCLRSAGMQWVHEVLLARDNKVTHFTLDIEKDPN
jgi:hypothetical protein